MVPAEPLGEVAPRAELADREQREEREQRHRPAAPPGPRPSVARGRSQGDLEKHGERVRDQNTLSCTLKMYVNGNSPI